YFPEAWQIALVVRPYRFEPVRGGFFFREADGSVQAGSSRHEFILKPVGGKPAMDSSAAGAPADSTPPPPAAAPVDFAPAPAAAVPGEPAPSELESGSSATCAQPAVICENTQSEPALSLAAPLPAVSGRPRRRMPSAAVVAATIGIMIAGTLAGVLFGIGR